MTVCCAECLAILLCHRTEKNVCVICNKQLKQEEALEL